jgi:hypothetical protein
MPSIPVIKHRAIIELRQIMEEDFGSVDEGGDVATTGVHHALRHALLHQRLRVDSTVRRTVFKNNITN